MRRSFKISGRTAWVGSTLKIVAELSPDEALIPLFPTDLSGETYSSSQIDDWLNRHVIAGTSNNEDFNVVGSGNPTIASKPARQTLWDTYNLIIYNEGYDPEITP